MVIFIYGPDGSGKTKVAEALVASGAFDIIIPFEPSFLGGIPKHYDSGYNGKNSSMVMPITRFKSFLLICRWIVRFMLMRFRYRKSRIVVTRGILEFGRNQTHRNFPSWVGNLVSRICGFTNYLLIVNIDTIIKRKDELNRYAICDYYERMLSYRDWCLIDNNGDLLNAVKDIDDGQSRGNF